MSHDESTLGPEAPREPRPPHHDLTEEFDRPGSVQRPQGGDDHTAPLPRVDQQRLAPPSVPAPAPTRGPVPPAGGHEPGPGPHEPATTANRVLPSSFGSVHGEPSAGSSGQNQPRPSHQSQQPYGSPQPDQAQRSQNSYDESPQRPWGDADTDRRDTPAGPGQYPSPGFGAPPAAAGPAPAPSSRPRGRGCGIIAGATTAALLAGLLGGVGGSWAHDRWLGDEADTSSSAASGTPVDASGQEVQRPDGSVQKVAAKALPAVVTIRVDAAGDQGTGSGFVYKKDGYIITNAHVAAPGGKKGNLQVEFSDGKVLPAEVKGFDSAYDIAVIKVDGGDLPTLQWADSERAAIGDPVLAIGSPFRLSATVTTGIISALNRPVASSDGTDSSPDSYISAIQTDAAINPGNSGGPLIDMNGKVLGINAAGKAVPGASSGFSVGLGFAIPAKQARRTADELISTGKATHPVIGASFDARDESGDGAHILDDEKAIVKDGPADKAGLKPGDRITEIDGKRVTSLLELVVAIRSHDVGEEVELAYVRDGKTAKAKARLEGKTD